MPRFAGCTAFMFDGELSFLKTAVTAGTEVVYNQRAYTPYTEPAI